MNFALLLLILLLASGVLWLLDYFVLAKRRPKGDPQPAWVEYGASFFPVILVVFVLRSFLVEPFKIPSGSMMPTLLDGDFILVNKFTYGIRLPVINKKMIEIGSPRRGDVVVFRFPVDPTIDYIKRVVGLPGDTVRYHEKRLFINGSEQKLTHSGDYLQKGLYYTPQFNETLGDINHLLLLESDQPAFVDEARVLPFPYRENCNYNSSGFECRVPSGHYFVMGDNRDKSSDGRYWGFVPDENIVGKAFGIWFHAESLIPPSGIDLKRIGSFN